MALNNPKLFKIFFAVGKKLNAKDDSHTLL